MCFSLKFFKSRPEGRWLDMTNQMRLFFLLNNLDYCSIRSTPCFFYRDKLPCSGVTTNPSSLICHDRTSFLDVIIVALYQRLYAIERTFGPYLLMLKVFFIHFKQTYFVLWQCGITIMLS